MSVGEIVLLIVGLFEFVVILVACSTPPIDYTSTVFTMPPVYDYEKDMLRNENYTLHKKLRDMEYKLYYDRPYGLTATEINAMRTIIQQPVEVNIENIIKISTNE